MPGTFTLKHLVFHAIDTTRGNKDVAVSFGGRAYNDDISTEFSRHLTENYYKKSAIERARFDETGDTTTPFEQLLLNYMDSDETAERFLEFSRHAAEILKSHMESRPMSSGGVLVFADIRMRDRFVFIALLNETTQYSFDESDLQIEPVDVLDINKLAMAGFINLTRYEEDKSGRSEWRYISFLKGLREVSDYFVRFLGAGEDRMRPRDATVGLVKAIKAHVTSDEFLCSMEDHEKETLLQRVYDHLYRLARDNEPVTIDTVSTLLDEDHPDRFKEFVQSPENDYEFDTKIESIDSKTLKNLVTFRYKGRDFFLSFDRDRYLNSIEIDPRQGTVTIQNAPEDLVESLLEEKGEET